MRKTKASVMILIIMLMPVMLAACGNKKGEVMDSENVSTMTNEAFGRKATNEDISLESEDSASNEVQGVAGADGAKADTKKQETMKKNSSQKLIKRYNINMETKEFDNLISALESKITSINGYIETSDISGNGYYSDSLRYANLVIRIPQNDLEGFVRAVSKLGNVISKQATSEDITLSYVDVESHKKALEIEQERLLALLDKSDKIGDIIKLETRLSEVRYELESNASQLRTYDNLVDFSTVTLNITEVERIKPVKDKTVIQKMGSGLSGSLYDIKKGVQNLAIWFVTNLPYLIIWAVIICAMIIIGRRTYKKYKNSKKE